MVHLTWDMVFALPLAIASGTALSELVLFRKAIDWNELVDVTWAGFVPMALLKIWWGV